MKGISDEELRSIVDGDMSWVLRYLEENTIFDVPRITKTYEFAKMAAVAEIQRRGASGT